MSAPSDAKTSALKQLWHRFNSSIGKKLLTGATGVALCLFILEHLAGNLLLLHRDPVPFNTYAYRLTSLDEFLLIMELGLIAVFLVHAVVAIRVALGKSRARPPAMRYQVKGDAGKPSRKSWRSLSMIVTGLVLLVFLVVHIKMFRFGPSVEAGYVDAHLSQVHGEQVRDLHGLVTKEFSRPAVAFGYAAVMLLLGVHLSHGFWSALQSLGVSHPRYTPLIYTIGIVFAIVMAVGFLLLPLLLYFRGA